MNNDNMDVKRWIFLGWCLTVLFYFCWYAKYDYIFGKSDVDNYLLMPKQQLSGLNLRHIIMQTMLKILPIPAFIIILPGIFWYGIVWPIANTFGKDEAFNLVFGTAAIPLFFIVALWSQFLAMAFMAWSMYFVKRNMFWQALACAFCSLSYLPIIYFYAVWILPAGYSIAIALASMVLFPSQFSWLTQGWNPAWAFVYYISPVIWLKGFFAKQWSQNMQLKTLLLSLPRLSRGLVFMFPLLAIEQNKTEKNITFTWWSLIILLAIIGLVNEASCVGLAGCERLHDYRWLYPSWAK